MFLQLNGKRRPCCLFDCRRRIPKLSAQDYPLFTIFSPCKVTVHLHDNFTLTKQEIQASFSTIPPETNISVVPEKKRR